MTSKGSFPSKPSTPPALRHLELLSSSWGAITSPGGQAGLWGGGGRVKPNSSTHPVSSASSSEHSLTGKRQRDTTAQQHVQERMCPKGHSWFIIPLRNLGQFQLQRPDLLGSQPAGISCLLEKGKKKTKRQKKKNLWNDRVGRGMGRRERRECWGEEVALQALVE